jgi:hypothetical protein
MNQDDVTRGQRRPGNGSNCCVGLRRSDLVGRRDGVGGHGSEDDDATQEALSEPGCHLQSSKKRKNGAALAACGHDGTAAARSTNERFPLMGRGRRGPRLTRGAQAFPPWSHETEDVIWRASARMRSGVTIRKTRSYRASPTTKFNRLTIQA